MYGAFTAVRRGGEAAGNHGNAQKQCEPLGIQISGGHTQGSAAVLEPVVTVTVIGLCDGKNLSAKNIHPGQDVILTKWIGISGIRQIIAKNRPEILRFYREDVIEKAQGNAQDMSVGEEAFLAARAGVTGMHDVSEGGILQHCGIWQKPEKSDWILILKRFRSDRRLLRFVKF